MSPEALFRPLAIGSLSLPNRVVMTTVKLGYAPPSGEATERHQAFYVRRARGGVGLLTTEPMFVQPNGREIPSQLAVDRDDAVPGLLRLVEAVHAAGGRIMAHVNHAGRVANPRLVAQEDRVSASAVTCPANQVTPRPLNSEEIQELVQAFSGAARRVAEAGFDALEVPFSHGYLIHQFLSPHSNRREDAYGGGFENRLRFGREVLEAIRGEVGPELPVVVRMNALDYVEGGLESADALRLAHRLCDLEIDALSVTSGTMCESVPFCLYPAGTPKAHLLPLASRIRETSTVPVIVAGRIRSPDVARRALSEGQTDLVGLGRPLLSDPDWVHKAEAGEEDGILLCAACHQGCLGELRKGRGTQCLFNPETGREGETRWTPAEEPRRVVVVGGGPAGLEAARVAAERGHLVSLYEGQDHTGGQLALAARVPHKEGFMDAVQAMETLARRAGVSIHLGHRISAEELMESGAETVVLATGSVPLPVTFPGLEDTLWALASEVLEGDVEVAESRVLVIGGGLVGLETADFLGEQGKEVTLAEMMPEVGGGLDPLPRTMLFFFNDTAATEIYTHTEIMKLESRQALAREEGSDVEIPFEFLVLAVGARSNRALALELAGSGMEVHVVGDAVEPRGAGEAIREACQWAANL